MIDTNSCRPAVPFHNKVPALCKPAPQVIITAITQGIPRDTNPDYLLLAPNSGLYVNPHGQLDINWAIVRGNLDKENDSEVGMETDCSRQVTWSIAPAQVSQGDNLTLNMAGLKPYEDVTVVLSYGIDKQYIWEVVANRMGRVEGAKLRITTGIKGTYKVAPLTTCATMVPLVETFEVITGNEDTITICDGNVTIVPSFVSTSVEDGAIGQLKIVISSNNSSPVTNVGLDWTPFPAGTIGTTSANPFVEYNTAATEFRINPIPSFPANSQQEILLNFKGVNQTFSDIVARLKLVSGAGTYSCGGNIYQAGGGSTSVTIKAGLQEVNELRIDDFSVTGLISGAVTAGTNLTFSLRIKNTGNTTITTINVGPIPLNNGNSAVTTNPANAGILASNITLLPGATHTMTSVASFDLANWGTATSFAHVVNVNAASIAGLKGSTRVVSSNSAGINFTINKVAPTPPTPPNPDPGT
jgi:hypothetical protein